MLVTGRPDPPRWAVSAQGGDNGARPSVGEHEALTALCRLAAHAVHGDQASIGVLRAGRLASCAATSDLARHAERVLDLGGVGVGLGLQGGGILRSNQMHADSPCRSFADRAGRELGIHSVLAHVMELDGSGWAFFAVYAAQPDAFTREHEEVLTTFVVIAAAILGSDLERHRCAHLQRAVHTNRRIGAALGIVMATQQLDLDDAWQLLSTASQQRNIKLASLAEDVIYTGELPGATKSRSVQSS